MHYKVVLFEYPQITLFRLINKRDSETFSMNDS